jgi:hypothetical protein
MTSDPRELDELKLEDLVNVSFAVVLPPSPFPEDAPLEDTVIASFDPATSDEQEQA